MVKLKDLLEALNATHDPSTYSTYIIPASLTRDDVFNIVSQLGCEDQGNNGELRWYNDDAIPDTNGNILHIVAHQIYDDGPDEVMVAIETFEADNHYLVV